MVGLLLLAMILLARFIGTSAQWLNYPYPRPGSEGLILYESLLLKHGGDIYEPITPDRFISGPYPPIFYWLAAAVLPDKLPDFSTPGSVTSIFMTGRLISLCSTVLAALLLPVLVVVQGRYRHRGRRAVLAAGLAGILAGVLFLSLPQVLVWATRFRGDMLMIALTSGGLTCVAIGSQADPPWRRGAWSWLVAGALLFALAFYTKQTALAGPIAAALYLLLCDWRAGLKWCVAIGALIIVPFAVLDIATNNWFYLKMVTYHSLPLRALTLTRLLQFAFWEDQWPLILLALAQAGVVLTGRIARRRLINAGGEGLLVPLFVLAAVVTLPTGAVVGADHNHLLMSGLAMCAGVGALVAELLVRLTDEGRKTEGPEPGKDGRWTGWRLPALLGGVTALLVAVYILFTSQPSSWYNPDLTMPTADQQEQLRKIVLNLSRNPGTLFFSDDPGLLALAGKQTPYDDPFTMTALAEENRWDESAYRKHLARGDFPLLLLSCDVNTPATCRSDTFTPGALEAIRTGYNVLFRDIFYTYAPKRQ
jgi:hypothetical protein